MGVHEAACSQYIHASNKDVDNLIMQLRLAYCRSAVHKATNQLLLLHLPLQASAGLAALCQQNINLWQWQLVLIAVLHGQTVVSVLIASTISDMT